MASNRANYRYLLDTNVILYLHDAVRQMRALEIINRLAAGKTAALPAQALAEFSSVALRKFTASMDANFIYSQVEGLTRSFPVLPLTPEVVLEALRGVRDHSFAYYDAQIWAVAKLHQIPVLLSEDFNSGSEIDGVTFVNPFENTFDLTTLL